MQESSAKNSTQLLTLPEISRRYGIGLATLREQVRSGHLPVYACGTAWPRASVSDVEAWIESTRIPAGPGAA